MSDIIKLTSKYLVIPTKYLLSPVGRYRWFYNQLQLRVNFKDLNSLTIYENKHNSLTIYENKQNKYFVMKLDDEFNLFDIIERLSSYHRKYCKDSKNDIYKIKGSDLALIILNSITDKSKLDIHSKR